MNTHLLTIAVDDYQHWGQLRGAVQGAQAFDALMRQKFGVKSWQSVMFPNELATAERIEAAMASYTPEGIRNLGSDDQLIVYFAGHGQVHPHTGKSFLIPVGADKFASSTWLSYDLFQDYFSAIKARHIFLISDACFSGGAFRGGGATSSAASILNQRLFATPGRHVLSSGGMELVDDDRFDGQSVFSWGLNSFLEQTDLDVIPARLLAEEVQVRVTANAAQTPEFGWFPDSGHQGGQLMIFRDGTPPQNWVGARNKTTQAVNASEDGSRPVPTFEHNLVGENAVCVKLSELISQSAEIQFLVTGMGGIGKTARVLQAVDELQKEIGKTALYLDVDDGFSENKPDEFLTKLILKLDPTISASSLLGSDIPHLWQQLTAEINALLLLDNVRDEEHWRKIKPSGGCAYIAISRHRLPGFSEVVSLNPMPEADGRILALRIGNLSTSGRLSIQQASRLHTSCDGLPLGIEVAASAIDQNPYLDVESFINTLEDVSVSAPRLQSWEDRVAARLRISLQWLNAEQRQHWALLALFSSAFQRSALAVLWETESPDLPLHDLLVRHLVMAHKAPLPSGEQVPRFRLHDLLRPLAAEILQEHHSQLYDPAWRRLNQYFTRALATLDSLGHRGARLDLRDHFTLISQDIDNIRSGIEFAKADTDWESAEALVIYALDETLSDRLPASERLALVQKALDTVERWRNQQPEAVPSYQQKLLLEKGCALRALSQSDAAEQAFRDGISVAKKTDGNGNLPAFWGNLGSLLLNQSNRTEEALFAFRRALGLLTPESSKKERSALLNNCGNALLRLGNLEAAKDAYWISHSLDEELEDQVGIATSKGNLANIAIFEGDYKQALSLAEEAARIEAELGLEHARAQSLQIGGKAAFLSGNFEVADQHFQTAVQLHEKLDQFVSETKARANLAAVAYQNGQLDMAYELARGCVKIAHQKEHLHEAAGAIRTMAMVLLDQNRLQRAFKTIRCALALHSASHSRAEMIEDVLGVAKIFLKDQQIDVAERYVAQAEEWAADHGQAHHHRQCKVFRTLLEQIRSGAK